jgi:AraC family transcriptional regulator of arabinose operon
MDFLESMRLIKTRPNVRHVGINESMVSKMNDLYLKHTSATNDMLPSILLRFINLFAEFHQMADSHERPESNSDLIKLACDYLSSDFVKHKSLRDFCFVHRVGYERFRKIFRESVGVSPHSYYVQKRIDAAINLLSRHDQTIGEIALKLGFSSQFEFSTQFKKYGWRSNVGTQPIPGHHSTSG